MPSGMGITSTCKPWPEVFGSYQTPLISLSNLETLAQLAVDTKEHIKKIKAAFNIKIPWRSFNVSKACWIPAESYGNDERRRISAFIKMLDGRKYATTSRSSQQRPAPNELPADQNRPMSPPAVAWMANPTPTREAATSSVNGISGGPCI